MSYEIWKGEIEFTSSRTRALLWCICLFPCLEGVETPCWYATALTPPTLTHSWANETFWNEWSHQVLVGYHNCCFSFDSFSFFHWKGPNEFLKCFSSVHRVDVCLSRLSLLTRKKWCATPLCEALLKNPTSAGEHESQRGASRLSQESGKVIKEKGRAG